MMQCLFAVLLVALTAACSDAQVRSPTPTHTDTPTPWATEQVPVLELAASPTPRNVGSADVFIFELRILRVPKKDPHGVVNLETKLLATFVYRAPNGDCMHNDNGDCIIAGIVPYIDDLAAGNREGSAIVRDFTSVDYSPAGNGMFLWLTRRMVADGKILGGQARTK